MLADYNHYRKFSELAEVFSLQRTTFLFVNFLTCIYCSKQFFVCQHFLENKFGVPCGFSPRLY
jgi:hypothetical protein